MNRTQPSLCLFLSFLLLAQTGAAGAPTIWQSRRPPSQSPSASASLTPPEPSNVLSAGRFQLSAPESWGEIEKISFPAGPEPRHLVVLLRDVHGDTGAQKALFKLTQTLSNQVSEPRYFFEGAFHPFPSPLKPLFHLPEFQQSSEEFFTKGKISGPLRSALHYPNGRIFGMDNAGLYASHLESLKKAIPFQTKARRLSAKNKERFFLSLKDSLSEESKSLLKRMKDFYEGRITTEAYAEFLLARQPAGQAPPRPLQQLEMINTLKNFSSQQAEQEQSLFIRETLKQSDKAVRADTPPLALLKSLSEESGVSLKDYPEFEKALRLAKVSRRLRPDEALKNLTEAETNSIRWIGQSTSERVLMSQVRLFLLTDKLLSFSLTSREWKVYSDLRTFLRPAAQGLAPFEDFYRFAEKRDHAMARNILTTLNGLEGGISIALAGGFHTDGIGDFLQKQGVASLVIRPTFEAEAENDHLKLMAGLSNIFLSAPAYPASTLNDLLTQAARLSATDESRAKFSTAQKNIALNDESGNQPPPSSLLFLFLTSNRVGMTDTPSLKWASLLSLPVETILLAGVFHFGVESAAFGFLAWNLIHWALERDSALFGDSTLTFRSQAVSVLGHSLVYLVYGGFFFTIEGPGLILGLLFHLVVDSNRLTPRPVKLLESIYWTQVKRVDTLVSQGSDAHALLSHFFTVGEIENRLFKGFPDLPPQTINPRLAAEENWAILKNDFEKAREEIKSAYRNLLMEINEGPRTRERVQAVVSKFQPSLAAAHSLYRKTFSELAVLEGAFPQFASQAKMPPSIRFAAIQKAPHPSCGLCKKSSDLLMEAMEELNLREKWHAELDSVPIGGGYIGPFHQFVNFLGETKEAAHPIFLSLDLTADQFGLSESVAEVDSHKQRLEKVRDEDLVKQRGLYHFQSHLGAAWAVYQFEKNVEWVRRRVKAPKDNGGEAESYFRLPQYLWKEFKEVLLSKEKEFPATVDRIVKRNRGIAQTYYSNYIWKIHIEKEVIPLLASFLFHKKKEKRPRLQSGHWRHSTGFVKRVLKFHESLHVFFKNNQGYLTFFLTHWMGIPREREKILQQNFARNFNDAFRDLDDAGNNLFWEELLVSFFTDRTFFHQVLKVLPKNFEDPREDRVEIPGEIAGFITFFKNSVDQRFQNIPSRIHPNRLKFLLDPQQTKSELRQKAWENPLHHILSRALAQGAAIYDLTRLEKDVWTKTSFPMEVRIKLFFMRTLAEKGNFRTWVFDFDKLLDPMADIVKLAVQIRWLKDEFEGRARLKQFLEEGAFGSLAEVVKKPSGKGIPPSLETSWQNLDWYFRNIRLAAEKTGSKIAVYTGTKDKPQLEELRTRVHENQEKIFYSGGSWGGWDLIPLLNPSLDHPSLIYAVKHVQGVNFDSIRPVYDPIKFISSAVQSLLQDEGWTPEQRSIALPTEGMDPVLDAFNATAQSLLPMIRLQENFSNYDDLLITEKMDWGGEGGDEVDNLTTPAPTEFPNEPVGGRPSFTGGGSGHPGPAVLTIKEKRTIAPLADFYSLLEEAGLSFRWEGISVLSKDRDLALAVDEEQAPLVHELLSRYPKKKIFLFLADKQARFGEELHNQYPERVFFTPVHGSDLFQNRKDKNFLHMDSFLSAVSSHPDRRNMLVLLPDELIPLTGPQADQWESLFEDVSFSVLRDTLIDIFEGVLLSASALSDILNLQRARIVQSQA